MKPYFNPPDGSNQPSNDTNTTSNDRPFDPPSTDNDTNPPDDELDLLDDSFHHNSPFDNSQADLEIKEPEDNTKEPEIAAVFFVDDAYSNSFRIALAFHLV